MKSNIKKSTAIIFIIIFALSLLRITYAFAFNKQDAHSDETWSYGLSNSHNNPFIFAENDKTTIRNFNEWISSDVFVDYLTVQEGERFDYASVWYNQKYDDHPPLFYVLLNTVCSFFPNSYSLWYGYIINVLAFIILMILNLL